MTDTAPWIQTVPGTTVTFSETGASHAEIYEHIAATLERFHPLREWDVRVDFTVAAEARTGAGVATVRAWSAYVVAQPKGPR